MNNHIEISVLSKYEPNHITENIVRIMEEFGPSQSEILLFSKSKGKCFCMWISRRKPALQIFP